MDELSNDDKATMLSMLSMLRKTIPDTIANDLTSVQPMSAVNTKELYESAMSEHQLLESGYKPVSKHSLLWIRDETNEN